MDFERFIGDSIRSHRVTQISIREIDSQVLATALAGLSERFTAHVMKNISRGAAAMLQEEIARYKSTASQEQIEKACELVYSMFDKIDERQQDFKEPAETTQPLEIRAETKQDIVEAIVALAELAREQGLLALEEIDVSAHPFLEKAITLVVDGTDPDIVISILERTKQTMVREYEDKLSMMIEGAASLQRGDNPGLIEMELEAYLSE